MPLATTHGAPASAASRRPAFVSMLQLPQRQDAAQAEAIENDSDPHILTFDEKRDLFELLTPREGADGELSTQSSMLEQQSDALSAPSGAVAMLSARSKTEEYLLSPRCVAQEFMLSPHSVPQAGDLTHRSSAQPFAEPSPREEESLWRFAPPAIAVVAAQAEVAAAAADNRALLRTLVDTQSQLAQVQSQLTTLLVEARPMTAPGPSPLFPAAAPQPACSTLPRARRRWGPAPLMAAASSEEWRRDESDICHRGCDSSRKAVLSVATPSRRNRSRLPQDMHPMSLTPSCASRISAYDASDDDYDDYRYESLTPARVATAAGAFLAGAIGLICVLLH